MFPHKTGFCTRASGTISGANEGGGGAEAGANIGGSAGGGAGGAGPDAGAAAGFGHDADQGKHIEAGTHAATKGCMGVEPGPAHTGEEPAGVKGWACAHIFVFTVISSEAVAGLLRLQLLVLCRVALAAGSETTTGRGDTFDAGLHFALRRK